MADNKRRQRLFQQLTRLREIEHRTAAGHASEALGAAHRSDQLASRARALADGYGDMKVVATAQDLAGQFLSGARMRGIAADVGRQAEVARTIAEARLLDERKARRKLDQLEDKQAQLKAAQAQQNDAQFNAGGQLARNVNSKGSNTREA